MSDHSVLRKRRRLFAGVFLLSGILCVSLLWVVLDTSPAGINDENPTESGEPLGVNPVPGANDDPFTTAYTSNPEEIKTLDDLWRLTYERRSAFERSFADRVERGRHCHELYLYARPSHETDVLLQSLEEATNQSPWDQDKIIEVSGILYYGGFDARILDPIQDIISSLAAQYQSEGLNSETGQLTQASFQALNTCYILLGSVGRVDSPNTEDCLINYISRESPQVLLAEGTTESKWKQTLAFGALNGIRCLPFYRAIPVLELIFEQWFPGVPTTICCLQDEERYSQKDLQYLLGIIDESYRQAFCEIPVVPYELLVGDMIAAEAGGLWQDWPQSTFRYGPGGVKLPLCPIER